MIHTAEEEPRRRTIVCSHCGGENATSATVCRHCMGPLAVISNTDPMGTVYSRGEVFSRATANPQKPIAFWGIMFLFGPTFLTLVAVFCRKLADGLDDGEWFGMLLFLLFIMLLGAILLKTIRNYHRPCPSTADDDDADGD